MLFRRGLENFFNHTCKVFHVDSWDEVLAFTNDWELLRILFPRSFKMMIEDGFSKSIENTCRNDVGLNTFFLEVKYFILNLFDLSILMASSSLLVVLFLKGMV